MKPVIHITYGFDNPEHDELEFHIICRLQPGNVKRSWWILYSYQVNFVFIGTITPEPIHNNENYYIATAKDKQIGREKDREKKTTLKHILMNME